MIQLLNYSPILDQRIPSPGLVSVQISPTAQSAAANTGIKMDTTPNMQTQNAMTPQQKLEFFYTQNTPVDKNGIPYNNDTTKMLSALALKYPGRGTLPDVPEPKSNGYAKPSTAYYQNHPDEALEKQMTGQGI